MAAPRSPVVARELRWTDFDPLREMYYLLYEERESNPVLGIHLFAEQPTLGDEVRWFAGLYERVLRRDAVARVAEVDGRVVGNCVVGRIGASASAENGHLGLLGILVHRDYRGRGVGRALLRSTLEGCRGVFELVHLSVWVENPRARRLYEEFGFVPIGRFPAANRRGRQYHDDDLMILDLRDGAANR